MLVRAVHIIMFITSDMSPNKLLGLCYYLTYYLINYLILTYLFPQLGKCIISAENCHIQSIS